MSESQLERLELEALQERNELHRSVTELKSQVAQVRHKLDPTNNARKHFLAASIVATAVGFVSGYGFGGLLAP